MKTVNICMAIHDEKGTYSKYAGVVMMSLLEHTDVSVHFHILTDKTLTNRNCVNLQQVAKPFGADVTFYFVDLSDLHYDLDRVKRFTVGTLFRLKMMEVLPDALERVLYLDADLVITMDVSKIFSFDMGENLLAACRDLTLREWNSTVVQEGSVPLDEYVNAGVVLWNLKGIRAHGIRLFEESNAFLEKHPKASLGDQDALNVIFRGRIAYLPEECNYPTVLTRKYQEEKHACIYHYQGDVPRDTDEFMIDCLFQSYLKRTPWWTPAFARRQKRASEARKAKKMQTAEAAKKALHMRPVTVFWGITGNIHPYVMQACSLRDADFFVDNDKSKWGTAYRERPVKSPGILLSLKPGSFSIIITSFRYPEIKQQLEQMGFEENKDFFQGTALLEDQLVAQHLGLRENPWNV